MCTVCVWYVDGMCTVCGWYVYVMCMVFVRYVYGMCTVCVRYVYGMCMVWYVYGMCMVCICANIRLFFKRQSASFLKRFKLLFLSFSFLFHFVIFDFNL